jgi:hypothetical protein
MEPLRNPETLASVCGSHSGQTIVRSAAITSNRSATRKSASLMSAVVAVAAIPRNAAARLRSCSAVSSERGGRCFMSRRERLSVSDLAATCHDAPPCKPTRQNRQTFALLRVNYLAGRRSEDVEFLKLPRFGCALSRLMLAVF